MLFRMLSLSQSAKGTTAMNVTEPFKYLRIKLVLVLTLFIAFTASEENERQIHINGEHLNQTHSSNQQAEQPSRRLQRLGRC